MTTLLRGVIRAYTAGTHRADVQPIESLPTRTLSVPVATNVPSSEVVVGRECAVLLFTDDNPDDGVVVSVQGALPVSGAPKGARYFTFGLHGDLTNEHSLDDADESTLTAGKDVFWKWNDAGGGRKFKIHDIGGDVTVELRGAGGALLGLGYDTDAYPRIQFNQDGELHMGLGSAPPAAKLVPGLAGVIQVPGSTKFQVVGALAYLPTPLNIVAAATTIPPNALVELTANASYTLTSTPTVINGDDGQQCLIRCVDTVDVITLQDQGTLAGSNLRLGAATRALGPRDSILLVYSNAVGDWTEIAYNTVI